MKLGSKTCYALLILIYVCSSINDDSRNTRTLSAGEWAAVEVGGVESSGLRRNNNVELTSSTSTDDNAVLCATNGRRCRSSLGRPWKDIQYGRQRPQRDVKSHPASLGHVSPPPCFTDHSTTLPEATGRRADFGLKRQLPPLLLPKCLPCAEQRESVIHVGTTASSSVSDDVFDATPDDSDSNKRLVDDASEKSAVTSACTVTVTSFPDSTMRSNTDVTDRLEDKNVKQYTPELDMDLSADTPSTSLVQHSLSKPHLVMRKSTSCSELSALTGDRENRKSPDSVLQSSVMPTSARRPLLQLQLGQKFEVVCPKVEPVTSFFLVNVSSKTSSTDEEKRSRPRDLNGNADNEYTWSELAQTEKTWLYSRQPKPGRGNHSGKIVEEDYYGVGVGCMEGDIIQRSSASSSSHREHQLIFV